MSTHPLGASIAPLALGYDKRSTQSNNQHFENPRRAVASWLRRAIATHLALPTLSRCNRGSTGTLRLRRTWGYYRLLPVLLVCSTILTSYNLWCNVQDRDAGYLYYYRRRVRKNLSAKFDQFLAARSQFDSDHRVDFSTHTSCQSATFVRPLFAFVLCFLRQKNHKQRHRCDESVWICVIDQLRSANDDHNALR